MQLENMLLKHVLLLNFFPENILLYESMPVLNSLSTYTGKREITLFFCTFVCCLPILANTYQLRLSTFYD